jgi:hypothetical protein
MGSRLRALGGVTAGLDERARGEIVVCTPGVHRGASRSRGKVRADAGAVDG